MWGVVFFFCFFDVPPTEGRPTPGVNGAGGNIRSVTSAPESSTAGWTRCWLRRWRAAVRADRGAGGATCGEVVGSASKPWEWNGTGPSGVHGIVERDCGQAAGDGPTVRKGRRRQKEERVKVSLAPNCFSGWSVLQRSLQYFQVWRLAGSIQSDLLKCGIRARNGDSARSAFLGKIAVQPIIVAIDHIWPLGSLSDDGCARIIGNKFRCEIHAKQRGPRDQSCFEYFLRQT